MFTLVGIFSGKGFSLDRFDKSLFSDWFDDFSSGAEAEVLKLEKEGKLAHSLERAWSMLCELLCASA